MDAYPRLRVLLADDHSVVAEGVRAILARDFDMVGVARNGRELLKLAHELRPDIIIADIAMPLLNGLDAAARLTAEQPGIPIIVMSGHDNPTYVRAAVRAGAKGYVLKARAEELPSAIRAVMRGKTYLPSQCSLFDLAESGKDKADPLSLREREILSLLAEGKAAKEVAALAGVSVRTIEFHKYNIMNKLGFHTTAELIRYALQNGVTSF